jgi:hypothetical protein
LWFYFVTQRVPPKGDCGGENDYKSGIKKERKICLKTRFAKSALVFLVVTKEIPPQYSATPFSTFLCFCERGNCTWCLSETPSRRVYLPDEADSGLEAAAEAMISLSQLLRPSKTLFSPLSFLCTLFLLTHCSFLVSRSCSVDSRAEKRQRGSPYGSSEMRLSEGSIKTGLFIMRRAGLNCIVGG